MGYRRMTTDDLLSIHRRWRVGQTISEISRQEGFDRKTVREYINRFVSVGLKPNEAVEGPDLLTALSGLLPSNERTHTVRDEFQKHEDEIIKLITADTEPVKPKTAYKILVRKYGVSGSYESFKGFMQTQDIQVKGKPTVPRLELPPGKEIQVDYCSVGYHIDPASGKNRRVHAFIGKLSCSRLPYVRFTYTQKQESFVESNVRMLEFYDGTSEYITIDNLKAGVMKPDVYDPKLNKAYAEFAEYYGTFINTCIVGHSKGKAKIERIVQEVRELYRELKYVHPSFSLNELNREALSWCREEYGMAKHGTTRIEPAVAFKNEEKGFLKHLPAVRFEVPKWKQVKVAPDQFFTFYSKRYAMPYAFRGKVLSCRQTGVLLRVFDDKNMLLREYVIDSQRVQWHSGDFPESQEAMMKGSYPQYLISKGYGIGPEAGKLIESILRPHAFIKARSARGVLTVLEKYRGFPFLEDVCRQARGKGIFVPKQIKYLLETEQKQQYLNFEIPRSAVGNAMIRNVAEYIN